MTLYKLEGAGDATCESGLHRFHREHKEEKGHTVFNTENIMQGYIEWSIVGVQIGIKLEGTESYATNMGLTALYITIAMHT